MGMIINIFYFLLCLSGLILISSMYLISYIKNRKFYLNKYDENYLPDTVVFLPCKKTFSTVNENLESVLFQDYKGNYDVVYIVESEMDPVFPVIKKISDRHENCSYVVAGLTKKRGQKNHNIIKALEQLESQKKVYDVYAFFDSDHKAPENWLTILIRTLTIKNADISTMHSKKEPDKFFPMGNNLYAMLNNYTYGFNTVSNQAWGGSLAIKREVFEKYKIKEIWERSISHDCPINGVDAKILFNPDCIPVETSYHYSVLSFIKWTMRQFTNWKIFSMDFWCLSFFSILANVFVIHSFIVTLFAKIFFNKLTVLFYILLGYMILSHIVLSLFLTFRMKRKIIWFFKHIIFIPIFLNVLLISFVFSIFNKDIKWAGKRYKIGKKGIVLDVIYDDKNDKELKN